jgi:hypothetical protein
MASKPRLDVSDGHAGSEACKRRAESARGVALHDEKRRRRSKSGQQRRGDCPDVTVGVFLTAAAELVGGILAETEVGQVEPRMLSGDDQRRRQVAVGECVSNRCELDGFRPGADHQPQIYAVQPSP